MAFPREAKAGRWVPSVHPVGSQESLEGVRGSKEGYFKTQVKPHNFGATLWSEDGP